MEAAPPFLSHPSELALLHILRGLVRGDEIAPWINQASVYGADPVDLTAHHVPATAADASQVWYFLCSPEKKNDQRDLRIRRLAGTGTWKGERGKPLDVPMEGGRRKTIGWRRTFSFIIKHKEQTDLRTGWIMVEIKLPEETRISLCLYKVYRSPYKTKTKKTGKAKSTEAPSSPLDSPTAPSVSGMNSSFNHLIPAASPLSLAMPLHPHAPQGTLAAEYLRLGIALPRDPHLATPSSALCLSTSSGVTPTAAAHDAAQSTTPPPLPESSLTLTLSLASGTTPPPPAAAAAPNAYNTNFAAVASVGSSIDVSPCLAPPTLVTTPIDPTRTTALATPLVTSGSPLGSSPPPPTGETSPHKRWVHVQISGSPTKASDNASAKRVYKMIFPEEEWSAPLSAKKRARIMKCSGWLTIEPKIIADCCH